MKIIPKRIISGHRLMFFLVAMVSFLAKNLTDFLIFESFIDGYMLIESIEDIVTSYCFIFSSSSVYCSYDAWTMEKHE